MLTSPEKEERKKNEFCPMRQVNEMTKQLLGNQKGEKEKPKKKKKSSVTTTTTTSDKKEKALSQMTTTTTHFTLTKEKKKKNEMSDMFEFVSNENLQFYNARIVDMFLFLLSERTQPQSKKKTKENEIHNVWRRHLSKDLLFSFGNMIDSMIYFFQQCDYYEICQLSTGGLSEEGGVSGSAGEGENPPRNEMLMTLPSVKDFMDENNFLFSTSSFVSEGEIQNVEKEKKEEEQEEKEEDMAPQIKQINLKDEKYKTKNMFYFSPQDFGKPFLQG